LEKEGGGREGRRRRRKRKKKGRKLEGPNLNFPESVG
jgi:hypothetical protein